jgi:hypothetical protein
MRLNKPVFLNTLRCQADAPVRLVLAGLMGLMLYALVSGGVSLNTLQVSSSDALRWGGNSLMLAMLWVLGLGLIRGDVASGSIILVLLRPLTRASYVLSKWVALACIGLALVLLFQAADLLHQELATLDPLQVLGLAGAQGVQMLAATSVLVCLSAAPMAFGELGLFALLAVGLLGLDLFNLRAASPLLGQALVWLWRVLLPRVWVDGAMEGALPLGGLALNAAFNLAVSAAGLAGAVALIQRREFSYAD